LRPKKPAARPEPRSFLTIHSDGITLALRVQPRGARNRIREARGQDLRLEIAAPPIEGRANEALIDYLADALDVARRSVTLLRGEQGRDKVVKILGPASELAVRLRNWLSAEGHSLPEEPAGR
jgi:uncharacterized protein